MHDPDPEIPDALDDRAADNWRPLLAIADLAGDAWPRRAREAACLLSGEGHEATSISVELLADIRKAFGSDDAMRTADLVKELTSDPERPWVEWRNGKPLTPKQLGGLLRPFGIISETIHIPGLAHAKGYQRVRFEDTWRRYLPGQNTSSDASPAFETCKRASADETGTSAHFSKRAESNSHGSKNDDLSHSHAGLHACTAKNHPTGREGEFDQTEVIPSDDPEFGVDTGPDDADTALAAFGSIPNDTHAQVEQPIVPDDLTIPDDLDIPPFLDRRPQPRQDGKWAGSYLSDDDIEFLESGKFK